MSFINLKWLKKKERINLTAVVHIWHINPFPNKPWFLHVCCTSLLKTLWEKKKLLITSNFSFSPQCFLPVCRAFCHFQQIWNYCLQTLSGRKSLKIVIWERVKSDLLGGTDVTENRSLNHWIVKPIKNITSEFLPWYDGKDDKRSIQCPLNIRKTVTVKGLGLTYF